MYIDTHAHLTWPEFSTDFPQVIERAKAAGVEAIINIALDDEGTKRSLELSKTYPGYLYTAAGLHPHEASQWGEQSYTKFKKLALDHQLIALGEMGLDYHYKLSPVSDQQNAFRQELRLAQELGIPAIIHSREAAADTVAILREENQGNLKGVLHCFAGDQELIETGLELGLSFSFTGNITFPKAEKIRLAAKQIPLEQIMIETDCPFLAPPPYRGKRNEPAYVVKVAEKLAEIKELTVEKIAEITTANAKDFFKL
jgi:TatD DNase family protein